MSRQLRCLITELNVELVMHLTLLPAATKMVHGLHGLRGLHGFFELDIEQRIARGIYPRTENDGGLLRIFAFLRFCVRFLITWYTIKDQL